MKFKQKTIKNIKYKIDIFSNAWPIEFDLCNVCGQPDSEGDCNHTELTDTYILILNGIPKNKMKENLNE